MNRKQLPLPKGIIFDMDGVLLLTTQSAEQSWREVCERFAPVLACSPQHLEDALRESRRTYQRAIAHNEAKRRRDRLDPFTTRREVVEQALTQVGQRDPSLAAKMVRAYEALRDQHRELAPHAIETLERLRACSLPLVLMSNGNASYQQKKIQRFHLAPFFQAILIEEEFGVAKPDPRIFQSAMNAWVLSC